MTLCNFGGMSLKGPWIHEMQSRIMLATSAKTWNRTNRSNTYRDGTLQPNFAAASSSSDRANCFLERISANSSKGPGCKPDGHAMTLDVHGLIDNLTKRQDYKPGETCLFLRPRTRIIWHCFSSNKRNSLPKLEP
jgi:hypothetical protein